MGGMFADIGMAAAGVLAVIFAWAGAAKLSRPAATATGFAALGLPRPKVLARTVPAVELVLGVALLSAPSPAAAAALALLAGFSAVLARALRRGVAVPCACFGQPGGPPLSLVDLIRNALLAALAVAALAAGLEPHLPNLPGAAILAVGVLVGSALLVTLRRPDEVPREST